MIAFGVKKSRAHAAGVREAATAVLEAEDFHRAARHVARGLSRRDTLVLGGAAAAGLAVASSPARAVTVDITQGNVQPMPIAIPDFLGGTPADNETAHGVTQIITNNLFGVDIMAEATEIARLRLFLALVASAQTINDL